MSSSGPGDPSTSVRAPHVRATQVLPLLESVASLSADATGALIFGDIGHPVGSILLEHGRVCWVFCVGMGRRLTDILRHQQDPPLDAVVVEEVYRRCLELRTPLGEALVTAGIVTPSGLRSALRQHNAEALAQLALGWPMSSCWVDHKRQRYDAQYTFSPAEILVSIGELSSPDLARSAKVRLNDTLEGNTGIAYLCEGDTALPLAQVGIDAMAASEVLALGKRIMNMCAFSSEISSGASHTILQSSRGATVVWGADIVFAAFCDQPSDVARLLGRLRRPR